ncbi:hypothetical protein LINGRAHAP2_LOCUS12316 [Linum grandiflorum]
MKSQNTMGNDDDDRVAISNRWLLSNSTGSDQPHLVLEGLTMAGLTIVDSRRGFVRCRFTVSDRITDGEGNWEVGAMVTLIDDVGAAAIYSLVGHVKASLDFTVSFFSTAKSLEEVELEGKVVAEKGKLTSVVIQVTRTSNGDLIAFGKQWMSSHNKRVQSSSKL